PHITDRSLHPKTGLGETVSSLLIAVVAASIVHNYIFQPFIIPTGSLEKSLLIGDFLIVSKFHYGARPPMTTAAFPMVHDTLPLVGVKSYLNKPQLPYMRLPALQKIKQNDIVVFSWPADTVRRFFVKEKGVRKPIDKKSNYVKRCVALPGDTLEIINGLVHTNGKRLELPDRARVQYSHTIYAEAGISSRKLAEQGFSDFTRTYKIDNITQESFNALLPYIIWQSGATLENFRVYTGAKGLPVSLIRQYRLTATELLEKRKDIVLTLNEAAQLRSQSWTDSVVRKIARVKSANTAFFPNRIPYDWNEDNFGPLVIPKAGTTVNINSTTWPLYKKIIQDYEKNQVAVTSAGISINGQPADSYTFKQNYYWMMGDNRHRSEDSRYWGFVPEDHIVGKPVFIWFSVDGFNDGIKNWKIRWDRVFTTVGGEGERTSYLIPFLVFIALWQGVAWFRKRKKATA
ncbi:MAG: signal peptidase I, partial [Flavobacteriaceae bacterium]